MKNVLIIGAGGVAKAVVHKIVQQSHLFGDINIATRSVDKIESILVDLPNREALKDFFQVNADSTYEVEGLLGITKTDIVINCASPYCNLSILDACIKTGCAYLDSARHEDEDSLNEPPLCYEKYEWTRKALCQENGITALLSLGFDPGVVNAYARHCVDTLDDVISLDIIDINAGSHGKYFATNFDPEINFREFMGDVHYYQDRKWKR
jgi:saccharopine dehydrogenase-like NADP-dependent oxidoreductase